jgi:hypothetical protein
MTSPFFSGYNQEEVAIRNYKGKSPMFFRDSNVMGALFTADLAAIRRALPDPSYRPIRIYPGRGLVAIHCLQHKDTDIGPYNELSLSIAIRPRRSLSPFASLRAILKSLWTRSYHAYVKQLPVTTEVAFFGGVDFFNYPKYIADITFEESGTRRVCTLRERGNRDLILEFTGRKIGTSAAGGRMRILTLNTYPWMKLRTVHASMILNLKESRTSYLRRPSIRFGLHPRAEVFKNLGLGMPLQYFYAPSCEAVLFKPVPLEGKP